jgi:hypothetical protein
LAASARRRSPAVCNDDDVIDFFEDGILWVTLGAQPDLLKGLAGLVAAFGVDTGAVTNLEEAERRLSEHLAGKRCLLVVDDVTETGQLRRIPRAAARAAGC